MKLALAETFLWCLCSVVANVLCLLYRRLSYRLLGKVKNLMEMWKVQVVLVHLVLLVCLMRIYYQTGPLTQLEPQKTMPEMGLQPLADRLVVFLAEGLRADTLFSQNCSRASYFREIIQRDGLVGISKTNVPSLTGSAQVALFAGFYEKPCLFHTAKFDSIFNRTLKSDQGRVLSFSKISDLQDRLKNNACLTKLKNSTRLGIFVSLKNVGGASPLDLKYQKKLHNTHRNIRDAFDLIESTFDDRRTTYLYTSAHGLTNLGSHGGGSDEERNTPFVLWGAGITKTKMVTSNVETNKIDQIQFAPLLSALIGLPPPVNNLAMLPHGFLNESREYERKAMHLNALQLLTQAKEIISRHERGVFHKWLPKNSDLDLQRIAFYQNQMDHLMDRGWGGKALETSMLAIKVAQKSLKSYFGYYYCPLVFSTAMALLGWQFHLLVKLSSDSQDSKDKRRGFLTWTSIVLISLGLLLGELVFLQWASLLTIFCLIVPFGIWCWTLAELPIKSSWLIEPLVHLIWIIPTAGVIIVTLYCSCPLSLVYASCVAFYNRRGWVYPSAKFLAWLALVCLLSGFLWSLPKMENLMTTNCRVILQTISMLLVMLRPLFLMENHKWRVWIANGGMLVVGGIGIYFKETGKPFPLYIMAANWTYLFYAFASVLFSGSSSPKSRLQLICFNLLTVHALLSDSYTSLFAQGLIIEFQIGSEVHEECRSPEEEVAAKEERTLTPSKHLHLSYRFAASLLLYFYVSLIGTGHWMRGFTYLANTARLFLPDCCSSLMPFLVLVHLLIPSLIILASLQAQSSFGRQEIRSIFTCVMLICNAVVFFFVVFVPHHENWPTAHPSVIKALLAQLTVILLLACDSWVVFLFRGLNMIRSPAPKRRSPIIDDPTVNSSVV
ncbi:GPI ethanolamine phosphate transferase 1 [Drosophila ficusphila]|uniref:GPI ethanolamine phosphate transferase 1 n=1 Tax=Drosophila ficusphila TaxID=30025 RepID=UPI0007E848E0|nr:GPI ethanolamine phosphate transferase 1 [Drosophila ficusphila]